MTRTMVALSDFLALSQSVGRVSEAPPSAPGEPARLTTTRLLLRPAETGDAAALFPVFADVATMRWWAAPPFTNIEAVERTMVPVAGQLGWTVCHSGAAIGRAILAMQGHGVAELRYLLAREHWGRGLAREAIATLLTHGFDGLGLRRISAVSDPENAAAIGALVGMGFTLEGQLREARESPQGPRDTMIFGLLAREWTGDR